MRFGLVINTYKRPAQALAVAETFRALQSGKHQVDITVAFDEEDEDSVRFFHSIAGLAPSLNGLRFDGRPRPITVQDCWNRNLADPDRADIWMTLADDGFCATTFWDERIAEALEIYPKEWPVVMGWTDQASPGLFTVPIVSGQWLKLIGGPLLDPRFPFWFADTAISETFEMVTGQAPWIPKALQLASMPGKPNPIMRDTDLWYDLYAATRRERAATAARIRQQLGLAAPGHLWLLTKAYEQRDANGRNNGRRVVAHLKANGLGREPPPSYAAAHAAALAYLGRTSA